MPLFLKDPSYSGTYEYTQKAVVGTEQQEYGLKFAWYHKDWMLESGLGYTVMSQYFGDVMQELTVQEVYSWDVFDVSYTVIDTTGAYLQIANNDSSWYYFTESNTMVGQDSTLVQSLDSISDFIPRKADNQFKYIELPLLAGYNFSYGRFSGIAKAGIITSLLHKASGSIITGPLDSDILSVSGLNIPVARFDYYGAIEARYLLTSRYFLSMEAYYRHSLKEEFFTSFINRKINQSGVKFGIGMYF